MTVHLEMDLDMDDSAGIYIPKLEHHIDWLLDLDSWSEIRTVYNARLYLTDDRSDSHSLCEDDITGTIGEWLSWDTSCVSPKIMGLLHKAYKLAYQALEEDEE